MEVLLRFLQRLGLQELPDSKCKTPRRERGLQIYWSRKEEQPMFLLMLLLSLVKKLKRVGIKIDFTF